MVEGAGTIILYHFQFMFFNSSLLSDHSLIEAETLNPQGTGFTFSPPPHATALTTSGNVLSGGFYPPLNPIHLSELAFRHDVAREGLCIRLLSSTPPDRIRDP